VRGPVPLGAHAGVVLDHGIEDRPQQAARHSRIAAKPVEHELGDGRVPDQLRPAEDLEVA
jgi:hypothetical protein